MLLLMGAIVWRLFLYHSAASPVPSSVAKDVNFSIYYPDPQKLPSGYSLDSSSFKQAQPGVIVYSINHAGGRSLAVSEEAQPAGSIVNDFIKNYIPLHNTLGTGLGDAQIGAYGQAPNQQSVASLSIKNGPWLIVTAPSDVKQTDLKTILQSLKR